MILIILLIVGVQSQARIGVHDFPKLTNDPSNKDIEYLNNIRTEEWLKFVQLGTDSLFKQKRLEENLLSAQVTVENGSISHAQLLDTLPNAKAKEDSEIAMKILKSSLYVYNTKCVDDGINGEHCESYLAGKQIPERSALFNECIEILHSNRDGHHAFRRLLPANYKNGFYEMNSDDEQSLPRAISKALYDTHLDLNKELLDEKQSNLALVQWTQFIEHDLSKPVVTSMGNGFPIECCDKDNYQLLPRFHHPACAPLFRNNAENKYGRETCLNYVRSALAVGSKCNFGAAQQLNQATGYLDLSQLYGYTEEAKGRMRLFKNGQLRSSKATKLHQALLPLVTEASQNYCAVRLNSNASCFMAGDSRVNNNPFAIVIYTIFMRNHNQIASKLQSKHPDWSDELLFQQSKNINVDIYRHIVFTEWLPTVLGNAKANEVNMEPFITGSDDRKLEYFHISNEFAVAAIRFYLSMMPNALHNFATSQDEDKDSQSRVRTNNVLSDTNIFLLKDQIYKTDLKYTTSTLNDILESLLHQSAMKLDAIYVESLISGHVGNIKPTHVDVLAFDIQRGRDHGLHGYVKYVEICKTVKVREWKDLENFMGKENINKLKNVYSSWMDIDLIVGGISEIPENGSLLGPTFTCILSEQFSKIRQWQHALTFTMNESSELLNFSNITAADLLCANSDLKYVPNNIFQLGSEKNSLIECSYRSQAWRVAEVQKSNTILQ